MTTFAKNDKLLILRRLENLETFVQNDQEPNFGSKKTRSMDILIPYSLDSITVEPRAGDES